MDFYCVENRKTICRNSQPPKRPKATSSPIRIKMSSSWITTIRDAFTNLALNRGFTYKIGKYRRFALCRRQHGRFLLYRVYTGDMSEFLISTLREPRRAAIGLFFLCSINPTQWAACCDVSVWVQFMPNEFPRRFHYTPSRRLEREWDTSKKYMRSKMPAGAQLLNNAVNAIIFTGTILM